VNHPHATANSARCVKHVMRKNTHTVTQQSPPCRALGVLTDEAEAYHSRVVFRGRE